MENYRQEHQTYFTTKAVISYLSLCHPSVWCLKCFWNRNILVWFHASVTFSLTGFSLSVSLRADRGREREGETQTGVYLSLSLSFFLLCRQPYARDPRIALRPLQTMTSPSSPLGSPSPCPPPPPSLPSSPTPSSPAPSSLPLPPALPPTGEVMVLALGRKRQRLLIGLSILPNLFLAFLLSSDPLLTLASPFRCRPPGPSPVPQVPNVSVRAERGDGGVGQCKRDVMVNNTVSGQTDCDGGFDYNVTEGLRNNIVTEVGGVSWILLLDWVLCVILWCNNVNKCVF